MTYFLLSIILFILLLAVSIKHGNALIKIERYKRNEERRDEIMKKRLSINNINMIDICFTSGMNMIKKDYKSEASKARLKVFISKLHSHLNNEYS